MLFPIIRIRDNDTGHVRIVGTNTHDTLFIDDKTGGIHYENLQNCGTTMKRYGNADYAFSGKRKEYDPYVQVEFVTFDELLEIYKQHISMSHEQERKIRDMIKTVILKQREKNRLDEDDDIKHTGGNILY